jgi:hypothetical protein
MSRAQANKLYTNFSRGLITEASPLAFPEGASFDEKNCDILNTGDRSRRYGFDTSSFLVNATGAVSGKAAGKSYVWREPGKIQDLNFLVIQLDELLYFWKINTTGSGYTIKSFTVDLTTYQLSSFTGDMDENPCQFTSGKGTLYVAHPYMNPIAIDYDDSGSGSISVTEIIIKIRDFIGLDDGLAVDEEPATLTAAHHYNLRNQGWINPESTGSGTSIYSYGLFGGYYTYSYPTATGPIADYHTAKSRYPSNSKQWWTAKDASGDFDPDLLAKVWSGNTRAPRGHFILDAFNKNYTNVSGVSSLTTVAETTRPNTIAFSSGRVFYGHRGTIYFSPILEDSSRAGQCFQEADPTSEDISDLIATDGGSIEIPNAENIVALQPLGGGIVVFAKNGVWSIGSGAAGFTALDYSVTQISDIGTESPLSVVAANNQIFWWSRVGIQALQQSIGQFGPIDGQYDKQNLSDPSIKTFFNALSDAQRNNAQGIFDPATNKVYWLYKNDGDDDYVYKNILIYDIKSGAFVPWSMKAELFNQFIIGAFTSVNFTYTASTTQKTVEPTFVDFIVFSNLYANTYSSQEKLVTGNFTSREYIDFYDEYVNNSALDSGVLDEEVLGEYDSYIISGYEVLEDGMRRKQAPFVGVFFKRIEDSVSLVGNDYVIDEPQSCFMQARWDWTIGSGANKWSSEVQVYRPKMTMFIDTSTLTTNTADYDVIYSRNKVRGSGRAVQFKFSESRQGYGFTLVGWHVFYGAKVNP